MFAAVALAVLAATATVVVAQPNPPVEPFNVIQVDNAVPGQARTFTGNATNAANNQVFVFRYDTTASFNSNTEILRVTARVLGDTVGSSVITQGDQCFFPNLDFLGEGAPARNGPDCRGPTGPGTSCAFDSESCATVASLAPYFVTVEYAGPGSDTVVVTIEEVAKAPSVPRYTISSGSTYNASVANNQDVVFGPLAGAIAQTVEIFVYTDENGQGQIDLDIRAEKNNYPLCDAERFRCNQERGCVFRINTACFSTTTMTGDWYFRVSQRGGGAPTKFMFRATAYATPAPTAVTLGAGFSTTQELAMGDSYYGLIDATALTSGTADFSVIMQNAAGNDEVQFRFGDPADTFACNNGGLWNNAGTGATNDQSTEQACQFVGGAIPFFVTFTYNSAVPASPRRNVTISIQPAGAVTTEAITLGTTYNKIIGNGNDEWFQFAYPASAPAAGSEFLASITNIKDTATPANGGQVRLVLNRGAAADACGRQRIRCENGPVKSCTAPGATDAFDTCNFASPRTGDMYLNVEDRTNGFNYTLKTSVVQPVAAALDTNITLTLAPGEAKIYSYVVTGSTLVLPRGWSDQASLVWFADYEPVDQQGCKQQAGNPCQAGPGGCSTRGAPTSCRGGTNFVKFVNDGETTADCHFMIVTTSVPTLALDTYENIVLPGNRDPVVRDVTLPTATSFHVNATTQNSQIRVEVENNCQRPAGASGRLTDQPNVNLYMVDQTAASTGPWRISVELRAGNTDTNATLFVETGTSCRSFASIKAGAGAALFCDGVVADTKMVSLRDTAVVLDNQAKLSFGFFDAVRPAGAAGTCQQASKDFVCNFMFPGCTTDGFQDRSAQCREDCESHVTSCYDSLCATSVCSRLNACSTTTGVPAGTGSPAGTTGVKVESNAQSIVPGIISVLALAVAF